MAAALPARTRRLVLGTTQYASRFHSSRCVTTGTSMMFSPRKSLGVVSLGLGAFDLLPVLHSVLAWCRMFG
jgi:hypothetical protein